MTLLAASIFGESVLEARECIAAAIDGGAELLEFRLDMMPSLSDEDIRTIKDAVPSGTPCILTIRSTSEGGHYDGGDDERVSRLIELGPSFEYVDVELALWRRSANIRQKIGLALRRAGHISQQGGKEEIEQAAPRGLILSRHDQSNRPASLNNELVQMLSEPQCDHPKLAWRARTIRDNFEALELMRTSTKPGIFICMGEEGLLSRVLARKFGAFVSFASIRGGQESGAGQLTLDTMKLLYRWDAIGPKTAVYGVIGDPVAHSLSPHVHNAAFGKHHLDAVYLPLSVRESYESFKAFMVEVTAQPWLDFRGFSVTVPHKENALRLIRESNGVIDPLAQRVGAVNTIHISDGRFFGFNTDYAAALDAIKAALIDRSQAIEGLRVLVLGAGGIARAIVSALVDHRADVTITNRTGSRADSLAAEYGCSKCEWDHRENAQAGLIVNCTTVGMWPGLDVSPLAAESLPKGAIVFDTIYRPLRTRLLRDAEARGCPIIDGLTMFAAQAVQQFELWTGIHEDSSHFGVIARSSLTEPAL